MRTFFRFHYGNYTLEEMQAYSSGDGGDGGGTGCCCCSTVRELIRNIVFARGSGAEGLSAEVVVFEAQEYAAIYDGFRAVPLRILARFDPAEFEDRAAEIAEEYETW